MHSIFFILCLSIKASESSVSYQRRFNKSLSNSMLVPDEKGYAIKAEFIISVDGTLTNDVLLEKINDKLEGLYVALKHVVQQALVLNEQIALLNANGSNPPLEFESVSSN